MRPIALGLALALAPASASAATIPVGGEIRLNVTTADTQSGVSLAAAPDGSWAAAWHSRLQDGSLLGAYYRRFAADGTPLTGEVQINTTVTRAQYAPAIAFDGSGGIVTAWASEDQDGDGLGVFTRVFDAADQPVGPELQANVESAGIQFIPDTCVQTSGDHVVAWVGRDPRDGSSNGILARRFDPSGQPRGADILVNDITFSFQDDAAITCLPDGGFALAWSSDPTGMAVHDVKVKLFDADGTPRAPESRVNTFTSGDEAYPDIDADPSGEIVVAWESSTGDAGGFGVFARRLDAMGVPLGADFLVHASPGAQGHPAVLKHDDGSFAIAFQDSARDGSNFSVWLREFDAAGVALAPERLVNTYTSNMQWFPDIVGSGGGDFVVGWDSCTSGTPQQDGSSGSVHAQRFIAPLALLRNGDVTSLVPVSPPLAGFLPLQPVRDLYLPVVMPGDLDPEDVLATPGAPLLFYALDGPAVLRLAKTPAARLQISY